ncbi:Membrane magnesium transporter, partial [Psidium guajava]
RDVVPLQPSAHKFESLRAKQRFSILDQSSWPASNRRVVGGRRRKATMRFGFAIGLFGVVILSHAAYSTVQYRGLLKIMEEEFSGPPLNVVAELLVGLVLCTWAALTVPGKFHSIHPDSEENRIVSLPDNMDFMIFNHRGRVLPSQLDLKLKH